MTFRALVCSLVCLLGLSLMTACGGTQEDSSGSASSGEFKHDFEDSRQSNVYSLPSSYTNAMNQIRERVIGLNTTINVESWDLAWQQSWIIMNLSHHLITLNPTRGISDAADRVRYNGHVEDLIAVADVLESHVRKRQLSDALERFDVLAERFNRISATYGPGERIPDYGNERSYNLPERYRDVRAGTHIYR